MDKEMSGEERLTRIVGEVVRAARCLRRDRLDFEKLKQLPDLSTKAAKAKAYDLRSGAIGRSMALERLSAEYQQLQDDYPGLPPVSLSE